MSRISRDIYTSLDVNGPYIRIDTQPTSTITEHNRNGTFTLAASTYYLTGDEAEIGDIDVLEADAVAPTDALYGLFETVVVLVENNPSEYPLFLF